MTLRSAKFQPTSRTFSITDVQDEVNENSIENGVFDEQGREFPVGKIKDGITEIGVVDQYGKTYPVAEVVNAKAVLPENIVEVGIVDVEGRQIPDHLESRDGDDEKASAVATSSSKPSKGTSLLVGGLGLAAGYYLANKYSQNRPQQQNFGGHYQQQQYNQGGYIPGGHGTLYPPQQHQQYNQGGYNPLPGGHSTRYPPQQSYNPYQQQYHGNNFGSSGGSFGSSGNNFGSTGSSFGSRPSYSTSSFGSSPSFSSSYSGQFDF